jgi:hypothetical protein
VTLAAAAHDDHPATAGTRNPPRSPGFGDPPEHPVVFKRDVQRLAQRAPCGQRQSGFSPDPRAEGPCLEAIQAGGRIWSLARLQNDADAAGPRRVGLGNRSEGRLSARVRALSRPTFIWWSI